MFDFLFRRSKRQTRSEEPVRNPMLLHLGQRIEIHNYSDGIHHACVMTCEVMGIDWAMKTVYLKDLRPSQLDPGPDTESWTFERLGLVQMPSGEWNKHHCVVVP